MRNGGTTGPWSFSEDMDPHCRHYTAYRFWKGVKHAVTMSKDLSRNSEAMRNQDRRGGRPQRVFLQFGSDVVLPRLRNGLAQENRTKKSQRFLNFRFDFSLGIIFPRNQLRERFGEPSCRLMVWVCLGGIPDVTPNLSNLRTAHEGPIVYEGI